MAYRDRKCRERLEDCVHQTPSGPETCPPPVEVKTVTQTCVDDEPSFDLFCSSVLISPSNHQHTCSARLLLCSQSFRWRLFLQRSVHALLPSSTLWAVSCELSSAQGSSTPLGDRNSSLLCFYSVLPQTFISDAETDFLSLSVFLSDVEAQMLKRLDEEFGVWSLEKQSSGFSRSGVLYLSLLPGFQLQPAAPQRFIANEVSQPSVTDWFFITSLSASLYAFLPTVCHESPFFPPTGSLFIFSSGLLLSVIYLSPGVLPVDVCGFCPSCPLLRPHWAGSSVGLSWSSRASMLICLHAQIWSLRLISKHEVCLFVCVWSVCGLRALSSVFLLGSIFLLFFSPWSCPGQDEWPAVTSSVFPQGWIHLPHVSLKGHTINCKQSLARRYLEDGERARRVSCWEFIPDVTECKQESRNFIFDTMDQMYDGTELWTLSF